MKLHLPESEEPSTDSEKFSESIKFIDVIDEIFYFFLRKFMLFLCHSYFSLNFPLFSNSRLGIWEHTFTITTVNSERTFPIDFEMASFSCQNEALRL